MKPFEVEEKIDKWNESLVLTLSEKNKTINAIAALVIVIVFFLSRHFITGINLKFLHYPNIASSVSTLYFLLAASIPLPFIGRKWQFEYSALVFVAGVILDVYLSRWQSDSIVVYSAFIFMALVSCVFLINNSRKQIKYGALFYTLICALILLIVFFAGNGWQWFFLKKPIFYFAFVIAYLSAGPALSERTFKRLTFSPAHLLLPINFPVADEDLYGKEEYHIWVSGIIQVIKAMLFTFAAFFLLKFLSPDSSTASVALIFYLTYLLIAPAVANFVTGVARLYFLNVPDCVNHLWLSSSPLEFMKRENVHAYQFSIRFFYFNFLKIARNPIVIILCYFILFPLYRDSLTYLTRDHFWTWNTFAEYHSRGYFFWALLFLAIATTFKLKFFSRRSEWSSVIGTHIVMYVIFYIFSLMFRMN